MSSFLSAAWLITMNCGINVYDCWIVESGRRRSRPEKTKGGQRCEARSSWVLAGSRVTLARELMWNIQLRPLCVQQKTERCRDRSTFHRSCSTQTPSPAYRVMHISLSAARSLRCFPLPFPDPCLLLLFLLAQQVHPLNRRKAQALAPKADFVWTFATPPSRPSEHP